MTTTPTPSKPFGAFPGPPGNILDDPHARVPLDRLMQFEYTWDYADGIMAGVVWVKPRLEEIDRWHNKSRTYPLPSPHWYVCVAENNGDMMFGNNYYEEYEDGSRTVYSRSTFIDQHWRQPKKQWYRKFILYEMTKQNLERVQSRIGLRNTLAGRSLGCDRETGMPLVTTATETRLYQKIRETMGAKLCTALANAMPVSVSDFYRAGFHNGNLKGWFQR